MIVLGGISVSRGIAIGSAIVLNRGEFPISEYAVPAPLVGEEVARFRTAVRKARRQMMAIRKELPSGTIDEVTTVVDTHLLMFDDQMICEGPVSIMQTRRCNAEWALKLQRDILMEVFERMDDPYLSARKADVDQVIRRIQGNLQGSSTSRRDFLGPHLRGTVVVADDLSPTEIMLIQRHRAAAFLTELGGPQSHSAILARGLGVSAVVGVHGARQYVRDGEPLLIDGPLGVAIVAPAPRETEYYRRRQREQRQRAAELGKLRDRPAVTLDGRNIVLMTNAEVEEDIAATGRVGADGVGLYRTELLFINRAEPPSEEELSATYLRMVRAIKGAPLTIRTLDLGGDKRPGDGPRGAAKDANPALGLRAIRWSLKEPAGFGRQLRAILRASAHGPVRIMFPLLSNEGELLQALRLLGEQQAALARAGIAFDTAIKVGGMIEVPGAALITDRLARHLDFLSIGTNDLIQYTLAVDRLDEEVNYLYDPLHPAVLKLVRLIIAEGRRAGIPVAMCGEMAGDPAYTRLLLGLGLREFSVYPAALLEVKRVIVHSDVSALTRQVRRALESPDAGAVASLVKRLNARGETAI